MYFFIFYFTVLFIGVFGTPNRTVCSVYVNKNKAIHILDTIDPAATAFGSFVDGLFELGWGILEVETNSTYSDELQGFAAGVVEGYLTARRIQDNAVNVMNVVYKGKEPTQEVQDFFEQQDSWSRIQTELYGNDPSSEWHQIKSILSQFDGLMMGYTLQQQKIGLQPMNLIVLRSMNAVGDLFQIRPAVNPSERIHWDKLSAKEVRDNYTRRTHCSALIRVLGQFEDLFMGHSSWFDFHVTNRIYKTYTFNFNAPTTVTKKMSFSSYAGFLSSLDDFYMMDSGLGMTQTSNDIINHTVYDLIKPQSLFAWQRVRLANVVAQTGEQWKQYFSFHPSGTYVNQYMIVDFNLFKPGQPLDAGLLWVIEEMPGLILGADVTQQLERGYWPSYNVPYFKAIWAASGYGILVERSKDVEFYYDLAPRANIFRRDVGKVTDMESFKAILRYNDFEHDPYSIDSSGNPNPFYAICSRGDLRIHNPIPDGCYDTKVTSFNFGFANQKAQILNGPTTSGGILPNFKWTENDPAVGLPRIYNFSFIDVPLSP